MTTAPRVTPADIEAAIVSEFYFTGSQGADGAAGYQQDAVQGCIGYDHLRLLTFCVLVLHNGFTVTGESACASPLIFDAEKGRKAAREKAVDKVWMLLGYDLKTKLAGCGDTKEPAQAMATAHPASATTYIGTKVIKAVAMTRLAYNELRGWAVPDDENPADEGYLVEYLDGGKANVPGYAGYVSWSPKDVFERAYHPASSMSFGEALEALEQGARVARTGWNGKAMWLSLSCNGTREVAAENFWSPHNAAFARENGGKAPVLPSITMKTATGEILMGWLASQTDMLAKDWQIV